MPSNLLGLIEMVFVFSIALGWGVYELLSLRRLPKPPRTPGPDEPHGS